MHGAKKGLLKKAKKRAHSHDLKAHKKALEKHAKAEAKTLKMQAKERKHNDKKAHHHEKEEDLQNLGGAPNFTADDLIAMGVDPFKA